MEVCTVYARNAPTFHISLPRPAPASQVAVLKAEDRNSRRKSHTTRQLLHDSSSVIPFPGSKSASVATIIQYNLNWTNLFSSHRCYQSLPGQLSVSGEEPPEEQKEETVQRPGSRSTAAVLRNNIGSSGAEVSDAGRLAGAEVM